ncbi:MAG: PP2C family protein-serine/threonine phosphatase [Bdellovibrionota bacterium]
MYLFLAFAVFAVGGFWVSHVKLNGKWVDLFTEYEQFGENCQIASGKWQGSFTAAYNQNLAFIKAKQPYRGTTAKADIDNIKAGEFLYTKCKVDFSILAKSDYAGVFLGFLAGKSAIFIDGDLRLLTDRLSYVSFPLSINDRKENTELSIISLKDEYTRYVGLASLTPLIKVKNDDELSRLVGLNAKIWMEQRVMRLAWAGALLLIFSVSWIFGIRYQDNKWMILLTLCFILESYAEYKEGATPLAWRDTAMLFYSNTISIAFGGFLFAFLRIKIKKYLIETFYLILVAFLMIVLFFYRDTRLFVDMRLVLPSWLSSFAFFSAAIMGVLQRKNIPANLKRRSMIIIIMSFCGSLLFIFNALYMDKLGIYIHPFINYAFLTIFACFLGVDLVVYHKNFLEEKNRRLAEENQRIKIEEGLKLGNAVQSLLLPEQKEGVSGDYKFLIKHIPSYQMAGDWIFHWQGEGNERFYIGDVVGKGPAAALATACICTTLNACFNKKQSIEATIKAVNEALYSVFKGKMNSTLTAAEIYDSGRVSLFNHGAIGWFHASAAKSRYLPIRNASLGKSLELDITSHQVELKPKERLISFTDGVIEGARLIKAYVKYLDAESEKDLTLSSLWELAVGVGKGHVLDDDQTFVAIEYKASN